MTRNYMLSGGCVELVGREYSIKEDHQLIQLICTIERFFEQNRREGESKMCFDLNSFPPEELPENFGALEMMLTPETFQFRPYEKKLAKSLKPFREYGGRKFYLFGKLHADGDQIIPFLSDAVRLNPEFKAFSLEAYEDSNPYNSKFPQFLLTAIRGETALLDVMVRKDLLPNKYKDKEKKAKKIVAQTWEKIEELYQLANRRYRSFSEI